MAEEENGGGGGHGSIKLPVIGGANKKVVLVVGGTAAAYVLWRYWQSSQAAGDAVAGDSDGDGYADAGTLPSVSGAVKEDNGYGLPDGSSGGSTDAYGFSGTTNSQWTQYAATQLSAASDKWSYGDVLDALGAFIANRPLTSAQQQIVQAAIASAGQPPEGSHPVISGGDTPITVAPGHVRTWDVTTDTQVCFQWDAVAGASHYRIYRSGQGDEPVGDSADTKFRAKGLQPNKSYTFQVAAVSAAGKIGPRSASYTAKTKAVVLAKPGTPRVTLVTKTSAHVSTGSVKGATGYLWYVNGTAHGHSDAPSYTLSRLSANKSYKVHVKADTANQGPGPASGDASFKTKK